LKNGCGARPFGDTVEGIAVDRADGVEPESVGEEVFAEI